MFKNTEIQFLYSIITKQLFIVNNYIIIPSYT